MLPPTELSSQISSPVVLSIAMSAGANDLGVDSLVLWDPVLNGAKHLEALAQEHREMVRFAHVLEDPAGPNGNENLGFPLPEILKADLATQRLLLTKRKPARRVLIIEAVLLFTMLAAWTPFLLQLLPD